MITSIYVSAYSQQLQRICVACF